MEALFDGVQSVLNNLKRKDERFTIWYEGEKSDFARFNHAKVRQPGAVAQHMVTLTWSNGRAATMSQVQLAGQPERDIARLKAAVETARQILPALPDDPYLSFVEDESTHDTHAGGVDAADVLDAVLSGCQGLDAVGYLAAGKLYRGFASSEGQRNWYQSENFALDWSLVHSKDKAVKRGLAGAGWDQAAFDQAMASARRELDVLSRPEKVLTPGGYRAWLQPAAVQEILEIMAWGGFSGAAAATKTSPLQQLVNGRESLSAMLTVAECPELGVRFGRDGTVCSPRIPLIHDGKHAGSLVNKRSAAEFKLTSTGANGMESPDNLRVQPGGIDDPLKALGTGLWVSNLWYLNFSDRAAGRITGMTRFATLWVENGEPVAPVGVMRFDDSFFQLLGARLEGLGATAPMALSTDTYGERKPNTYAGPGALVGAIQLTL